MRVVSYLTSRFLPGRIPPFKKSTLNERNAFGGSLLQEKDWSPLGALGVTDVTAPWRAQGAI
jgi:hypothetical protein